MASQKLSKLVYRLIEQSEKGNLKWEESATAGTYQVAFPGYSVELGMERAPFTDETDYVISIRNDTGELIESVSDVDLREDIADAFKRIGRLYETARRTAMGVDKALDAILSELPASDEEVLF